MPPVNAEKANGVNERTNVGSLPRRATSLAVAAEVDNPEQYTKRTRPWRPRVTPFPHILKQEYNGDGSAEHPFIVSWLPEDPENPQTFAQPYKWTITLIVAIATLAVALTSSGLSGATESIERDFGVTDPVILAMVTAIFVLGFAIGPLFWAPLSEMYGRRNTLLVSYVFFTLWNAVAISSPNVGALIVFRFLAGAFGSSPLTNAGGTISDVFSANQRGLGMAIFASAPFLGPALGPICGGFIGMAGGWKWVLAFLAIFTAVLTVVCAIFVPETYGPRLLRQRAGLLSKVTGRYYRASIDAKQELDMKVLFKTSLSRPWILLFMEPIVLAISIYMSIVYGTLYMLFGAFPIVFEQGHGFNPGESGLSFCGLIVGMIMSVTYIIFYVNPNYIKLTKEHGGRAPPEARLPASIIGAVLLVIGLAWFAATDGPSVHWIVPILAGIPFSAGMLLVFLSLMNYLVDCYVIYAASVLAANSVLRSLFGFAFPLFTTAMFNNLGVHWGAAVPGFLALIMLPAPFLFYKYGAKIRASCKYTKLAEEALNSMNQSSQPKGANDSKA